MKARLLLIALFCAIPLLCMAAGWFTFSAGISADGADWCLFGAFVCLLLGIFLTINLYDLGSERAAAELGRMDYRMDEERTRRRDAEAVADVLKRHAESLAAELREVRDSISRP
jgi:pilus assembly protein TadC